MDDLVQWLRAQLDEDERVARGCSGRAWWEHPKNWVSAPPLNRIALVVHDGDRGHVVRHDPARVLREIDAKRGIVGLYASALEERAALRARMREVIHVDPDEFGRLHRQESELIESAERMLPVVRLLAVPYADQPGYREEWRP
ncbi:hypothetical protein H1V43_32280 [Streptomyces sp. PSKA54]|uniref:Uncharacterized protein n=1 Tax=Streptomyces himalayensis subsp. aureolus TaxID=2758039 RepID=A0A7W2D7G5_9ACTN|nr:DUF6221 family protein [Streptomyces himalayensis]MBA4865942.1 hypothetical protein [Streptomyces himalayensis subsp. aureolus]